jgi:2'-5' RNA ligase
MHCITHGPGQRGPLPGWDYIPHVTLVRLDDAAPEAVHADQFVLYESTLTPDGARHAPQAIYPLNG